MAGKLQQIIRQRLAAQHRRAADAKRFTEGDDKQIRAYLLRVVAAAAPLFAERADTVRVVNQQKRAGHPRRLINLSQRRAIAVHAKNAFGHHQLLAG